MYSNKWVICPKEQSGAKVRMFCFPYAGGGASVYFNWTEKISNEIELCIIKLPGRESRFSEEPCRRIAELIDELIPAVLPLLDKPFMFFGHSLGAHISFHLTRQLRKQNLPCPLHIFISGARAPYLPGLDDSIHYKMEDKKFTDKVIEIGGMTEEILQNTELLDLVIPILRADIEMLNTVEYTEDDLLDCSITSFWGEFDKRVSRGDSEAWREHTTDNFHFEMIPGKHLFINTHQDQIIDVINQKVAGERRN